MLLEKCDLGTFTLILQTHKQRHDALYAAFSLLYSLASDRAFLVLAPTLVAIRPLSLCAHALAQRVRARNWAKQGL